MVLGVQLRRASLLASLAIAGATMLLPSSAAAQDFTFTFIPSPYATGYEGQDGDNTTWLGNVAGGVAPYSLSINWGDGTVTTDAYLSPDGYGGTFMAAAHAYAEEGDGTVSVTVTDASGASIAASFPIKIFDAPISQLSTSDFSLRKNQFKVVQLATFGDYDRFADVRDYVATVSWGDGSSSSCPSVYCYFATTNGSTASQYIYMYGDHIYRQSGTFTVTINLQDVGGAFPGPATETATVIP